MADKVTVTFGYEIDRSSVQQVTKLLDETRKRTLSVEKAAGELNQQLASTARVKAIDQIAVQARAAAIETGNWRDGLRLASQQLSAIGASQQEVKRVSDQIAGAAQETNLLLERYRQVKAEIASTPNVNLPGAGGGRTAGETISGIGRSIFNAPAVGPSTPIARVLQSAGPAIDKLGLSLGQVGALAGVAGVGVVAVALALEHFNKSIEGVKRNLDSAIEAQNIYFRALQDLTSWEAGDQLAERERDQRRLQQQIEETQGAIDSAWNQMVVQFGDAGARALEAGGLTPLTALREQLTELQAEAGVNEHAIVRLTQGMAENAFAANDLRWAMEESAKESLAIIQQRMTQEQELASLTRTASSEQVRDRLAMIEAERATIQRALPEVQFLQQYSAAAVEQTRELNDTLAELEEEEQALLTSVLPLVEAREREAAAAEALTAQTDAYFEALEAEGKARQALVEAQADINAELERFAAKQDDIAATLAEAEGKARDAASQARQTAEGKARDDEVKALRDHLKRRNEITRTADLSLLDARRTRDVVAAIRAQEQRDEALRKEGEALQERIAVIDDNLQKQNEAVDKRLDEQLKSAQDAANKATRLEKDRHDKQLGILRQAYQRADVALQNALNAQALIYNSHFASLQHSTASGMNAVVNAFGQGLITMVQQVQAAYQRINVAQAPRQYSSPIGPQPAGGSASNLNNTPFQFLTPLPQAQSPTNYITVNTATNRREVSALSNRAALSTLRQILED